MQNRVRIATFCLALLVATPCISAQAKLQGTAFDRLSRAKIFAFGPVGYAGKTSQEEIDYRLILDEPMALVSFEKLYASGNMQAKSYALTAIRKISPERFKELYATLPASSDKVATMNGCIVSSETLNDVAKRLASPPNPSK